MAELTDAMIQRRLDRVASGTYSPNIPGLPGILFVGMTNKERGISSRTYSSNLKELMAEGGYFSRALLPAQLEKACKDNGIDPGVRKKRMQIMARFYKEAPAELLAPFDQLTEEEVRQLSPEAQEERNKALEERGKRINDFLANFYTEEDEKIIELAKQVDALEKELDQNTYEFWAEMAQKEMEVFLCARRADNPAEQYFETVEDVGMLALNNRAAYVALLFEWTKFKEGLDPQFFRSNSPLQ